MNNIKNKYKRSLGNIGEEFVLDKLKTRGFELYARNLKYIDSEIDLVVYRYDPYKNTLDIRIIEVKTRAKCEPDLQNFDLIKKWGCVSRRMFEIKERIDCLFKGIRFSGIHFDLVLVSFKTVKYQTLSDNLYIYSYIKDVNLLL